MGSRTGRSRRAVTVNLARVGVLGVLVFAVAVVALHLLPTGLDPVGRTISEYVNEPYGALIPIAGFGIALGSTALTLALGSALPPPVPGAGLALLALWSGAMLIVATFPTDPVPPNQPVELGPAGVVHVVAGAVAFLAFAVAAPLISRAVPRDARLIRVLGVAAPVSLVLFVVSVVNVPPVSRLVGAPLAHGLGERIMVAVYVGWLLAVGGWLLRANAVRADGRPG
jgi:hypothetical protein